MSCGCSKALPECDCCGREIEPWLEGKDHGWIIPYALLMGFVVFVIGVVVRWW